MNPGSFIRKYKIEILLLLVLTFSIGIRMYNLERPESYYFDEVYFAFTAQEMAKGNRAAWESWATAPKDLAYEWTHPPLGKEISAVGILMFGPNTLGWRFFQALFGGLGALFMYLLARNLFDSRTAGLLAALVYSFDGFFFALSRITMVDIFMADFLMLASLFIVKYARTRKNIYLMLTGLFCGLSMSIKWSGVYIWEFLAGVGLFLVYYYEIYKADTRDGSYLLSLLKIVPRLFLAFVLIPVVVYILTYLPFFYHGNSFMDFLTMQQNMYIYHGGVTQTHPYQSPWWQWPLLLRPVFLFYDELGDGLRAYIYLVGNPFIWWTGIFFSMLAAYQVFKKEYPPLLFAVVSVFAYWLPWAFSPRKIVFIYHFMPSLVFVFVIISYFLWKLWEDSRKGRIIAVVYLLLAAGVFFYFYPVLSAVPIDESEINRFMWLSTWR